LRRVVGHAAIGNPAEALFQQALELHRQSRLTEARVLYEKVVKADPRHSGAWYLLGHIAARSGQPEHALVLLGHATLHDPSNAAAHNETGNVLLQLELLVEAAAAYERAIVLNPNSAEFHSNRGNVLYSLKRFDAALGSFDAVVALDPRHAGGHYNRGLALYEQGRFRAAIEAFDRAIAMDPGHARAHAHRGHALYDLALPREALQSYDDALALRLDYADAHNARGNALLALEDYTQALASFDAAIALQPDFADAHNNRGNALHQLGLYEAALSSYTTALSLRPDYAGVNYNCAQLMAEIGRPAEALPRFERALALNPELPYALGDFLLARMQICDWRDYDSHIAELELRVKKGEPAATPFCMLALTDSAALQKLAAENWIQRNAAPAHTLPADQPRMHGRKIRIGYFSVDFREHPVARLAVNLFELHDRTRFEVFAFSFGPDTRDDLRKRLENAFDRFIDVRLKSSAEIAALARQLHIDVAVDLTGLTKLCRPKIFAMRAAPVQVSYLGFLGTMGAPWIDYLIADHTLVPALSRQHFVESIVYLPSYQANDSKDPPASRNFARHELGLPATGFVFCCFNGNYKITPAVFASWMRILERVPDAALLLYAQSTAAVANIRKEARNLGVAPERIVFAGRLAIPDYLARYRSADLFLDTFPYTAGTTASDALRAGLPILTRVGETFSSRMAASLLEALDMRELITSSPAEYEESAVALATHGMAATKDKLEGNLRTAPLFDARRHTIALETAYVRMCERNQLRLPAADIDA
jgi:predicted O-linked N-acetylglucosamine transferase (SPINDLY family)